MERLERSGRFEEIGGDDPFGPYVRRALRGFGVPQLVWAYESHTDIVARGLGIDPLEFRRRNVIRDGGPQATGTPLASAVGLEGLQCFSQCLRS